MIFFKVNGQKVIKIRILVKILQLTDHIVSNLKNHLCIESVRSEDHKDTKIDKFNLLNF